jgi:hypothetical protein
MRIKPIIAVLCAASLAALACEVPTGVASTLAAEGQLVATEVAKALTETAAAETLPSGGIPEDTPTVEMPATTEAPAPTAAVPHLRVAFISGGSPWLVAPPSAAYQLSTVTGVDSVDLSDDGQLVAYTRHDTYSEPAEIRVVNWDGSGDRTLLTSAQVGALEPLPSGATLVDLYNTKWIPGTHNLLISTRAQFEGPGLARFDDLFLVNADSGVITTVFAAGNGGEAWPSPDGTKMVISRATSIAMSNIDGTGVVANIITFPAIITYSEYEYYPEAVWAGDSARFGMVIASEDPLASSPSAAIWLVDAATHTASLASTLSGNFFFPRSILSPTLDRVSYVRPTADPAVKDLYVSALDGSSGLHLASGNAVAVESFSPDGQYFCYYFDSGTNDYIGSLGGGTVAVPGGAMRLIWYDNTHFVYASGTVASWTLKTGDTGGGSTVIATPSGDKTVFDVDE